MDSKKIIKKYIMTPGWVSVLGILTAVLLVVCIIMGIMARNADTPDPVDFYPSETPTGTMAYIDVVGVSNWLYQYDSVVYYSVEDAYGYLYTVRLSDKQYGEMAAQQEYWNRTSETDPMPEAYHLVGYVQKTTDEVKQSLAQSWDLSVSQYEEYFGIYYLNATTSVGAENSAGWFVGALFSGLVALLCLIFVARASAVAKKCLARLEQLNLLDRAAQQLDNPMNQTVVGKNRGILTQDFLFGKGTGAVLAYSDIRWAYQQNQRRNFVVASSYLMAGTEFMNCEGVIDLNRADRNGYIGDAMAIIAQRNPNALLGFTNENRQAYNAIRKAAK